MRLQRLFRIRKSRKYPIKRDKEGLSLRARSFERFDQEKRPVEVAEELRMKVSTACRYFEDWKRLGPNFERQYTYVKELLKKTAPDRDKNVELFARACGIQKEQLETILSQPHGLRRLMTGKFYFPAHADADHKRYVALELAMTISDHLENNGGELEDVLFAFRCWMQENRKFREEEDADIKEENQATAFTRQVLEAAVKEEQQGRVKLDRLSDEERNLVLKYGIDARKRELEKSYWQRISTLMAEGLTMEQAREKIYQDLLKKGDLEGAKMMREYQDVVHPLKPGDRLPPPSPPQPPPSPK